MGDVACISAYNPVPARFPALLADNVQDLNRVLCTPLSGTLSSSLRWQISGMEQETRPDDLTLNWQWGSGCVETRFPLAWLIHIEDDSPLSKRVNDDLATLWARIVLESWREKLAKETDYQIDFTEETGDIVLRLALTLQYHDRRLVGGSLGLDIRACRQLIAMTPEPDSDGIHSRWNHLILPLAMVAGRQSLPYHRLARLRPGDVVMLTRASPGTEVVYAGQTLAWAGVEQSHWVCRRRIAPYVAITRQEDLNMTLEQTVSPETSLDTLTLTLECWLGETRLTLAELQRLTPGAVLGVAPARQECVELRVNGQRIGSGELVELGEGLGVRISRLATS